MFIIRNPSLEPQRNIGKGYMNLKKPDQENRTVEKEIPAYSGSRKLVRIFEINCKKTEK
jgi:hypothetical protein